MTLFHTQPLESEPEETDWQTPGIETTSDQPSQETVAPDVDAAVRLFSDKRFRTRKSAMVWAWTLIAPVAAWAAFLNFMNGDFGWMVVSGFFLATAFTLNRLATDLDRAQVALQTNLDK